MIDQVFSRVKLLVAQGLGVLIGEEKVQVRALSDEPLPNINRIEPYGLSYRAKPGCEVYMAFPAGDRAQGLALIIGDKRYQMTLTEGEVALHDDEGNYVHIQRGGTIEVKASTQVLADTPLVETTGDMLVGGNLRVAGQTTSDQGYGGEGGGRAWLRSGVLIEGGTETFGSLTNNGKDVGANHTHAETGGHTLGAD